MKSLSNIDFSKLSLFESIIVAFQAIREDFPTNCVLSELKNRTKEAESYISCEHQPKKKLEKLLELFYTHWNFGGASGIYNLSDTLWIDNVLKTHQGTAASLGIILLHIARELKLPLNPVVFPTQLILRADWINKKWLINPFNGDILNQHTLEVWLKGNILSLIHISEPTRL
jgi:regulator of sirC expression with transglutaminase-like and TPR domain